MTEQNHSAQDPEVVVGDEPTTAEAVPDTSGSQDLPDEDVAADAATPDAATPDDATPDAAAPDAATPNDAALAAERLADLQRLQAEYVNYKRRVDRDRALVQERAAQSVVEALLPVLDDIHAAREHGDLAEGPFAAIADKLEGVLAKFGLQRYGAVGEEFDPMLHEALMHTAWPQDGSVSSTGSTTVVQVLQPGYRAGEQILRAARVAVADPE